MLFYMKLRYCIFHLCPSSHIWLSVSSAKWHIENTERSPCIVFTKQQRVQSNKPALGIASSSSTAQREVFRRHCFIEKIWESIHLSGNIHLRLYKPRFLTKSKTARCGFSQLHRHVEWISRTRFKTNSDNLTNI